jgi:RNA polymerase sigma-70 factor, ECF subfamily
MTVVRPNARPPEHVVVRTRRTSSVANTRLGSEAVVVQLPMACSRNERAEAHCAGSQQFAYRAASSKKNVFRGNCMTIADAMGDLVRASRAASDEDVEALILGLWPTAYRIAWLILRDEMAAEDVAQESCLRAIQRRSQLRDPSAMTAWFRSLVSHFALSRRRQSERRSHREAPLDDRCEIPSIVDLSAHIDLAAAIERLGDELRVPLVLVCYGGFTSSEVARRLKIAPATVRYRLAAARNVLRPLLEVHDA